MTPQELTDTITRSVNAQLAPYIRQAPVRARSSTMQLVKPHADKLYEMADAMEGAGIGCHATRGHAAYIRQLADSMMADAAMNKIPDAYHGPGTVSHASASTPIISAAALAASPVHAAAVLRREEGNKMIRAMGCTPSADGTITAAMVSAALKAKGFDPGERMRRITQLRHAGLVRANDDGIVRDEHGAIDMAAWDESQKGLSVGQRVANKKHALQRGEVFSI